MGCKWHRHDSYNPSNYNIDTLESKYEKKLLYKKNLGLKLIKISVWLDLSQKFCLIPSENIRIK